MTRRIRAPFALIFAAAMLAIGLVSGATAISAQGTDATPSAAEDMTGAFPAHIHSGTCDELGDVVFPLNEITRAAAYEPAEATPIEGIATPPATIDATPGAAELAETTLIASSTTVVEAPLDDILADEHAINVHQGEDAMQTYIACGVVTGEPADGELRIELQELNDSGYSGTALLMDNGDGTTTVTVELMLGADGTPEATPAS